MNVGFRRRISVSAICTEHQAESRYVSLREQTTALSPRKLTPNTYMKPQRTKADTRHTEGSAVNFRIE